MSDPSRPRRVTAATLHTLLQCPRKLWLDVHAPAERRAPTSFDEELRARGIAHERAVRDQVPGVVGPLYTWEETRLADAARETLRLLRETRAPLYQPAFVSDDDTLAGVPDLVAHDADGGLVIRDAKLFTRLEGHGEVALQMAHYRALVEAATGQPVTRTEIVNGRFDVLDVRPSDPEVWREQVERAHALIKRADEPVLLQAHSTCEGCGYYTHCWERAVAERWLAILPGVNKTTRPRLDALGIDTIERLAETAPEALRGPGVTAAIAETLVLEARAMAGQRPVWRGGHGLPVGNPRAWLDLEGDPDADVEVPIYMWGVGTDRADATMDYRVVIAEPGLDGDRGAWERFLALAREVFEAHPDVRWVHYSDYERNWVKRYRDRHGDPDGTAARVLAALFDLRQALQRAAVLPLRSYGIKWVAKLLDFHWRDAGSDSQWSTVEYRRARASADPDERRRRFEAIARYNEDDLRAMRHVWDWMVREAPSAAPAAGPQRSRRRRPRPPRRI